MAQSDLLDAPRSTAIAPDDANGEICSHGAHPRATGATAEATFLPAATTCESEAGETAGSPALSNPEEARSPLTAPQHFGLYYDVVVVGAGLAGLQCASLLGKRGIKVLLIDQRRTVAAPVRTTGIFVRRNLEDFPLPEDCLGPPVRHARLYSPCGQVMSLESHHDEFRIGRMSRLYLHYLEICLHSGVHWLPGTRCLSCEPKGRFTMVRFFSSGRIERVRARYIVGADGTVSQVSRDLGLGVNREWIVALEDVFEGARLEGPACFHCFLDAKLAPGYLAWLVNNGEELHAGVGGYPSRFDPRQALRAFTAILQKSADLENARRVESRSGRIAVGGIHHRLANRHGLLVGDAAGAPSPLTAGGLDACLRLSAFAASVIGNYLDSGREDVLKVYSGSRFRWRFISRLWMRRLFSAIRSPRVLDLAFEVLQLPLMRSVAWNVFFGRGSFPEIDPLWASAEEW